MAGNYINYASHKNKKQSSVIKQCKAKLSVFIFVSTIRSHKHLNRISRSVFTSRCGSQFQNIIGILIKDLRPTISFCI